MATKTENGQEFADASDYTVERQADLFAAGEYPDRQITVTEVTVIWGCSPGGPG